LQFGWQHRQHFGRRFGVDQQHQRGDHLRVFIQNQFDQHCRCQPARHFKAARGRIGLNPLHHALRARGAKRLVEQGAHPITAPALGQHFARRLTDEIGQCFGHAALVNLAQCHHRRAELFQLVRRKPGKQPGRFIIAQ